jgi:hypothetical protein
MRDLVLASLMKLLNWQCKYFEVMDIYFDKENLISYITNIMSREGLDTHYRELNNMLIEQCDIFLSCDEKEWKSQYSEKSNNMMPSKQVIIDKIATWMKLVTDGGHGHKIHYSSPFPYERLDSFCEGNYKIYTSVIFQNIANYVKNKTGKKGLLSSHISEVSTLQKLFIRGKGIPSKLFYIREEDSRSDIYEYVRYLPCTDIIIADPYIFTDPEEKPYKKNAYFLISLLCDSVNKGNTVNVVFYTYDFYKDKNGEKIYPCFKEIRDEIKNVLKENKKIDVNITFVKPYYNKKTVDNLYVQQHDRYVITNYCIWINGNSFNYYNDKEKYISKGCWSSLSSICDNDNFDVFCKILSDIQRSIDYCPKDQRSEDKPELYIYGDMKSNLLDFSK